MNRQDAEAVKQARKKSARRTAIIAAAIAIAIFALSIIQMLKFS
ncbi:MULTISPECIES: hypothetical protein [Dyella]|nr:MULTISPECIES: hypothetical protein [Dyella]